MLAMTKSIVSVTEKTLEIGGTSAIIQDGAPGVVSVVDVPPFW